LHSGVISSIRVEKLEGNGRPDRSRASPNPVHLHSHVVWIPAPDQVRGRLCVAVTESWCVRCGPGTRGRAHPRRVCEGDFPLFASSSRAERPAGRPRGMDIFEPPRGGTAGSATTKGPPHLAEERYPGMNDIEPRHSSSVSLLLARSGKSPGHARGGRVEARASLRVPPDACAYARVCRTTRGLSHPAGLWRTTRIAFIALQANSRHLLPDSFVGSWPSLTRVPLQREGAAGPAFGQGLSGSVVSPAGGRCESSSFSSKKDWRFPTGFADKLNRKPFHLFLRRRPPNDAFFSARPAKGPRCVRARFHSRSTSHQVLSVVLVRGAYPA
jgi:hypothetical protein